MKLHAWSLVLLLAVGAFLAPAFSHRGLAQETPAPANSQQTPPPAKAKPDLPPGPGREPFVRICSGCHATSVATSEHRTAESWGNIVDDMRARGANGSDEEMDQITDWLSANYPPKSDVK
jgi:cytochrome c5